MDLRDSARCVRNRCRPFTHERRDPRFRAKGRDTGERSIGLHTVASAPPGITQGHLETTSQKTKTPASLLGGESVSSAKWPCVILGGACETDADAGAACLPGALFITRGTTIMSAFAMTTDAAPGAACLPGALFITRGTTIMSAFARATDAVRRLRRRTASVRSKWRDVFPRRLVVNNAPGRQATRGRARSCTNAVIHGFARKAVP